MAAKKNKHLFLYNLLVSEVSRLNKTLPANKRLSQSELYVFISDKIYGQFKGQNPNRLKGGKTGLRAFISKQLKKLSPKRYCDLLAINPADYIGIEYFAMNDFLFRVLPPCVYVKVLAGEFGETEIFNTGIKDYYTSGVADITNNINNAQRGGKLKSSLIPLYLGEIQLREGGVNNGEPGNYYLLMMLKGQGIRFDKPDPLKLPERKKTKKNEQRELATRKKIDENLKLLKSEKSVVKRAMQSVEKEIKIYKAVLKEKMIPKDVKIKLKNDKLKSELKRVQKLFDDGTISKRQLSDLQRRINQTYK